MNNKLLALIGAALLIVGVLVPVVSLPIIGSMNLLMPGGNVGDGIFVVVLAAIAGGLALAGKTRHVVWPGLASLAFIVWKYFQIKSALDVQLADPALASVLGASVQMNLLGWGVLGVGALLLVYAGFSAWKGAPAPGSAG